MSSADVPLTDAQRHALQLVFDVFHARGEWPSYQYVDHQLHRGGLPSAEVLASLPLELAQFDRYNPSLKQIELTIEALAALEGTEDELGLFIRAVRWLARRERDYEPPSPIDTGRVVVTSTEFTSGEGLELDRMRLAKILALLRVEWLTIGSGGPGEEEPIWQVTVDERIRAYAEVASVGEYLATKHRIAEEARREVPRAWPIDMPYVDALPAVGHIAAEGPADPHKVFVVYGRNDAARIAMFELLRAVGLHPLEWSELRAATGKPSPYIGEILDAGFALSQACVVLMTPDDEVRLRDEFVEDDLERIVSHQPRPNVLLEAGMALDKYRDRTVIVELGRMRQVSDLGGIHTLRMNDTREKRRELAERLRDAECDVRLEGSVWETAGDFESAIGRGPPTTRLPSVDTNTEREPIVGEVGRRLEAQLEDANDLIGEALRLGRFWTPDQQLPLAVWERHEHAFSRLGRDVDKPVRDAFRKLNQLNGDAQRRAAAGEAAVGTVDGGPTLEFGDGDRERLEALQGVLRHAMDVLRGLQI